jgi:hypothetical protein
VGTLRKERYPILDDLKDTVVLPYMYQPIARPGNLQSISISICKGAAPVYVQVWRPVDVPPGNDVHVEYYKLRAQIRIDLPYTDLPYQINITDVHQIAPSVYAYEDSTKANRVFGSEATASGVEEDTMEAPTGSSTRRVQTKIKVDKGDLIGFYFPGENPIPYSVKDCQSNDEQFRYVDSLSVVPLVGQVVGFLVAPLARFPCRNYDVHVVVGKFFCDIFIHTVNNTHVRPYNWHNTKHTYISTKHIFIHRYIILYLMII